MTLRLYLLQRFSALAMAPLVVVHIVVIILAVQGGLTATEILGRTQGSLAWAGFYGLFVAAAAVHAAIGLRVVFGEWLGLSDRASELVAWLFFAAILGLGARAVWAVTFAGVLS